jgi:predicted regulator of Ras-like GTPase activity (Roadblock/LC7/MglB family)
MSASTPAAFDFSSIIEGQTPLEAVLVLSRTGKQLGSWTRNSVSTEVLTVMAATLVGSVDTLVGALGVASPPEVILTVDSRRILVVKVNPHVAVLIVASDSMSDASLRAIARRIGERLPLTGAGTHGKDGDTKGRTP